MSVMACGIDLGVLLVEEILQNSQVIGATSAFLVAYISRSKPFFPGNIEGLVRSNSTTSMVRMPARTARGTEEAYPTEASGRVSP